MSSSSQVRGVESRYPARVRTVPERFIDIQLDLSTGKFHGKFDQYVRKHIQDENVNININKHKNVLSGYVSDGGFVVEDEDEDNDDDVSDDESCASDSEDDE